MRVACSEWDGEGGIQGVRAETAPTKVQYLHEVSWAGLLMVARV